LACRNVIGRKDVWWRWSRACRSRGRGSRRVTYQEHRYVRQKAKKGKKSYRCTKAPARSEAFGFHETPSAAGGRAAGKSARRLGGGTMRTPAGNPCGCRRGSTRRKIRSRPHSPAGVKDPQGPFPASGGNPSSKISELAGKGGMRVASERQGLPAQRREKEKKSRTSKGTT